MNVAVIGAGKMGLPLAAALASRGASVCASDVNAELVARINAAESPFDEPGLDELLSQTVPSGSLRATTDNREAIESAAVCVVIVPVVLDDRLSADLSIITGVAEELADGLAPGSLVSFETTVPVGTTRRLGEIIGRSGMAAGVDFGLAFSPERVKSGTVIEQLARVPKIVGGIDAGSASRAADFYRSYLGTEVRIVDSLEAAELTKLAGMVYRDVNIALANELANYAVAHGLDFSAVREAANTNGESHLLQPGIGVGGHCTPVYPRFLLADAGDGLKVARAARGLNEEQPARVLERVGDVSGRSVLILGLGFRPQVKEAHYSPAFTLRDELERRGAVVQLHDPLFTEAELRAHGFVPAQLNGQAIVILNTAHDAYASIDFDGLAESGTEIVVDGRDFWPAEIVRAAGLRYIGVAKPEGRM